MRFSKFSANVLGLGEVGD